MTMLRPFIRSAKALQNGNSHFRTKNISAMNGPNKLWKKAVSSGSRGMATQSGDEVVPPTALATLHLEDGTKLVGRSFGSHEAVDGEVVFSTGMVGYPESLTDPSYQGQILTLTSPMIGNYGAPSRTVLDQYGLPAHFESSRIHAKALLVQDYSHHYSHWNAESSLGDWLKEEGVPGICGLDTRFLTKKIREKGAMMGKIEVDLTAPAPDFSTIQNPNLRNLVAEVSTQEVKVYGEGNPVKVLAVDCGMKNNIIRQLVRRGAELTVVPWNHPFADELQGYDGLFLSNGPGDPAACVETIEQLRQVINCADDKVKPIFGICLGNQLMGLAAGGTASKLPFGNRGQNQPVINHETNACYITPQNHGFAIDNESLPTGWKALFTNLNDGSNEGIMHEERPYFTAQFHPEAACGPTDTEFFFDSFLESCKKQEKVQFPVRKVAPPRPNVKKVLLLGSGGTSIGQAGEFDYSGAQAIKALKEEGLEVVLMNPNIASVQTNVDEKSVSKADHVFFLPVTPDFVEEIIKKEKPDGIIVSMGGQTALNCAVEMYRNGIFDKYDVKVLGTPISVVEDTEDRQKFSDKLHEIDEKIAESYAVENIEDAVLAANRIGYPLMIRSAYALGGLGSGIMEDEAMLRDLGTQALAMSTQILVEKSMKGWKEVEYEVVRDAEDNCVTVCNMENFDPLGIHTGDSIVMAPSQTLSNDEYHMLRNTAIKVVRHLGIVGECNIQYALDPHSMEYCIIEVNARLSRSSALASKATGYPLAFVAAKLSLGIPMTEVQNAVTKKTQACFEPSLDYVVTKIPRWDLSKFENVSKEIGSAMKSVGEVMGIGRTLEESMQKALRMVDPSVPGFQPNMRFTHEALLKELEIPTDKRVFAIAQALHEKTMSVKEIHEITKIDHWFLRRLEGIVKTWDKMEKVELDGMSDDLMMEAKKQGYSDDQISNCLKNGETISEDDVRTKRVGAGITPWTKQIDTLAAEYPAETNYLYMTYHGCEDDVAPQNGGVMVLGSGAYRIGSSIEFDWCGVSCIRALRKMGYSATMINYNPETVSTDYDECDRLYFEELNRERVLDIYQKDNADGVVVSVGGQIPNGLALPLDKAGVRIIGTPAAMIDNAEDRFKFSDMIDDIGVQQPRWRELSSTESALDFAANVGYPVLVRPSYVLSGAAMNVAWTDAQLKACLEEAATVSSDHPVVISDFIEGAVEIEMDGVGKDGELIAAAIHEHVENAGVHSGDATLVLPPQDLSAYTMHRVRDASRKIVKRLNITGPVNIQFVAKGTDVMCIECNVRASRSFPFVSKTMGVDFIEAATMAMMDEPTESMNLPTLDTKNRPANYVGVKAPMFSFTRLRGSDPVLGVEMASTGEVACFGANKEEAFLKALLSTGFQMPKKNILVCVQESLMDDMVHCAWTLHEMGFNLHATPATGENLKKKGIPCTIVGYPSEAKSDDENPNFVDMIKGNNIDMVINIPTYESKRLEDNFLMRRTAVDFGIPLLTNLQLVKLFTSAVAQHKKGELTGLKPESLFEHYSKEGDTDAWTNPSEFH